MPRIARNLIHSPYYHVMVQGENREFIFSDDLMKNTYLNYLMDYAKEYHIEIIAYCIMGNHAHILIKNGENSKIFPFMHKINTKFGILYNNAKNRVGYVFRDRYKAEPVNDLNYLHNCIKYIHMNPVKAMICEKQQDYFFSSYRKFKNKMFLTEEVWKEIFPSLSDFERVISEDITFDNDFLEETYSLEDAKKWMNIFISHFQQNSFKNSFESQLILGLKKECKLSIKSIYQLTQISEYKIRKVLKGELCQF